MPGDKPSGADNQQERPRIEQWIVGFVDGEGCFSCPIQRNRVIRIGWQLQPMFAVVQAARSLPVLEMIQRFFGCGKIHRNRRHDNHREDLFVYQVFRRSDLLETIIPFFEANPLRTAKAVEFRKFAAIVRMMDTKLHLTVEGLVEIARIAQTMNHRKPSRFLESPEAIRQPALLDGTS
jgi:LAGLIDADG endonuclease